MSAEESAFLVCRNCLRTLEVTPSTVEELAGGWRLHDDDGDRYATCDECEAGGTESGPVVLVTAEGITVRHGQPMSPEEARDVALRLLEASTAHLATERTLRRPVTVDEALRGRDDG